MEVLNKTPHPVHIVDVDNKIIKTYPKDEKQIRLAVKVIPSDPLFDGTPTTITEFGKPEGLPPFNEKIFYIVSQMVKDALPDRKDLLVPAEVIRDKQGNIIGCKSLGR